MKLIQVPDEWDADSKKFHLARSKMTNGLYRVFAWQDCESMEHAAQVMMALGRAGRDGEDKG